MFIRPVIIFDNALGDFVLAAPTIRAISAFFGGRAELVCNSGVAKLFSDRIDGNTFNALIADISIHSVINSDFMHFASVLFKV